MKNKIKKIISISTLCIILLITAFICNQYLKKSKEANNSDVITESHKIKNIIFMIGDGMGENHILAGEIYKGEELNIQKISNKIYVTTASTSEVTDSAAAGTALATGNKTNNGVIGKDESGNNLENLTEYLNSKGLKTGIVVTQILNHATPAAFTVHNESRFNYDEIAQAQIESCVDILLGGGRNYFSKYEDKIEENNYKWVNNIYEIEKINKNEKIIGTFADESISEETNRIALSDMTQITLDRLENENGFFLMVEGSNIDTYSHQTDISKMLVEIIDFDNAVKTAMNYVDNHPDTLLIVTADHETGGLDLKGITEKEQLEDTLFTSGGAHTSKNVLLYAYGAEQDKITKGELIDNTQICEFIKNEMSK